MPSVSVLIPCYNAERWVADAIQSALNQTVPVEVVVVDDGSNDRSVEIIKQFKDKVKLESGPNLGGNRARNRLLELASGEWVQFLDSDDYLKPSKIETQLGATVDLEAVDAIYSPVICETWDGQEVVDTSEIAADPTQTIEEQWIRWCVAQTGSVLWKSEPLKRIGGWNEDYPCCQDNEVTLRALKSGFQFHYSPQAGAVYRVWSEETVCRKDPAKVIRFKTKLIDEMLDWLKRNSKLDASHLEAAGQAFFEMARTISRHDIPMAQEYVSERKSKGPFHVIGPAAPANYQMVYRTFGFKNAERLAAWKRK